MPDFLLNQNWLFWVLALVVGFPFFLILLGEMGAKLKRKQPRLIGLIQIFRNFVLPSLALFILLLYVLQLLSYGCKRCCHQGLTYPLMCLKGLFVVLGNQTQP